jgi:hypothetical protein
VGSVLWLFNLRVAIKIGGEGGRMISYSWLSSSYKLVGESTYISTVISSYEFIDVSNSFVIYFDSKC